MNTVSGVRKLYENEKIQLDGLYLIPRQNPIVFVNQKDEPLGYCWQEWRDDNELFIEFIEMIEKENGYGTAAISLLFELYKPTKIVGEALVKYGMASYCFWESLGAELELAFEEAENCPYNTIPFVLENPNQQN